MDLPYSTSTSSWQEHHYHCWKEQCKRILHWRFQQLATVDGSDSKSISIQFNVAGTSVFEAWDIVAGQ
jgi:hypothetical protein